MGVTVCLKDCYPTASRLRFESSTLITRLPSHPKYIARQCDLSCRLSRHRCPDIDPPQIVFPAEICRQTSLWERNFTGKNPPRATFYGKNPPRHVQQSIYSDILMAVGAWREIINREETSSQHKKSPGRIFPGKNLM